MVEIVIVVAVFWLALTLARYAVVDDLNRSARGTLGVSALIEGVGIADEVLAGAGAGAAAAVTVLRGVRHLVC